MSPSKTHNPQPAPLDLLVVAAHPDDAEISVGGLLACAKAEGRRTGVVDLTRGESGTYGTPALREREAAAATAILGLDFRQNLGLPDARLADTPAHREALAEVLRATRPRVVLIHDTQDRHPDHVAAGHIARHACFLAGLIRLSEAPGLTPTPHRPTRILTFYSHRTPEADVIVDVSPGFETKKRAVLAHSSQVLRQANGDRPEHPPAHSDIVERMTLRARLYGASLQVAYGEPLGLVGPLGWTAADLFGGP